ncbi:N-formylglutamate amidohydrolase [Methylocystis bryophila]|uniref:N-formylglutamate amidohydrolase n=1 Tax=Methylocystis bryophila TaxID=655015 RepID=UPI001FD88C3B|nr:N-formylglutamate amidohydrolase [Methylocystis bryophila]
MRNEFGSSPFFILVDHAGNSVPRALDRLGVSEADCERHIAWDIGAAAVAHLVADTLDATLVQQNYSRLVIDCNRAPGSAASIPEVSELTRIPGNIGLSESQRTVREREIFWPYHDRIAAELDRRLSEGRRTVLVALHSFTPVYLGVARAWQAGLLYNRDPRFAKVLMTLLRREELLVGDNQPYSVSDATDYSIPVHGERRGLLHVEVEIRQDLIADEMGQKSWATRLARLLPLAHQELMASERPQAP